MNERPSQVKAATRKKMRAVSQEGTAPELAVRSALISLGIAHSLNIREKPGSPDVWLTEANIPIFVHGCFWHRHPGCKKASTPKTNRKYWTAKFKDNIERDARVIQQLEEMGHPAIIVWQCETTSAEILQHILETRIVGIKG